MPRKAQNQPETTKESGDIKLSREDFDALMNRLNALENNSNKTELEISAPTPKVAPLPSVDQFGRPTGVIQKYSVDTSIYANPVDALLSLPEIQRFAPKENYELTFTCEQFVYETKFASVSEPRFELTLYKKMFDAEGKPENRRMVIQKGIFFEDPVSAIKEATRMGIPLEQAGQHLFLEQMRFFRFKDWLLDIFFPTRLKSTKVKTTSEVIGGRVVDIETYSTVEN